MSENIAEFFTVAMKREALKLDDEHFSAELAKTLNALRAEIKKWRKHHAPG